MIDFSFFTFRNAIAGLHMKESDKLPYIVAESTSARYTVIFKLRTELFAPKILSEVLVLSQKRTFSFSFRLLYVFPFFFLSSEVEFTNIFLTKVLG